MDTSPKGSPTLAAPLLAQLGIALAALIGMAFAPPAQGRVLLVPLTAYATAHMPIAALGHRALLLGSGPFPGSLVVMAGQENLTWPMLRLWVLPIAAAAAGCGPSTQGAPAA